MPTITRARTLAAEPEEVWRILSDPERLPAWWPGVKRVEEASPEAWTKVLVSPRGKTVRADYTLDEVEPQRRAVWRQELEESPFEGILAESLVELELEPEDGGTRVILSMHLRPRGFARFGGLQLRRASGRQLEEALDGLDSMTGPA